jgi:hypothetical protein
MGLGLCGYVNLCLCALVYSVCMCVCVCVCVCDIRHHTPDVPSPHTHALNNRCPSVLPQSLTTDLLCLLKVVHKLGEHSVVR